MKDLRKKRKKKKKLTLKPKALSALDFTPSGVTHRMPSLALGGLLPSPNPNLPKQAQEEPVACSVISAPSPPSAPCPPCPGPLPLWALKQAVPPKSQFPQPQLVTTRAFLGWQRKVASARWWTFFAWSFGRQDSFSPSRPLPPSPGLAASGAAVGQALKRKPQTQQWQQTLQALLQST